VSLLEVRGVSKRFPGVRALDGVDFDVERGEIHALVGENGAGKSTLIKILAGALVPDEGDVRLDGAPLPVGDPTAVQHRGVSIVYQEFTLVPELSAAENVFLGRERGFPLLRRREMGKAAQEILDRLGADVTADERVASLSVAQQQLVEIARALVGRSQVLVLDEPTAALSPTETRLLMDALRGLRADGLGIIYVSHRLEEIFALADRVTVLRDGQRVAGAPLSAVDRPGLIRWMVGREVSEEFPPRPAATGTEAPILEVNALRSPSRFRDVSFAVRPGEIVGLAGLVGSGRTSVALSIFGAVPSQGEMKLDGKSRRFASPAEAIAAGLGYVTEDRKARGVFPLLGADVNVTITHLRTFARAGWLSLPREATAAAAAMRDFDVRSAGPRQTAGTLSGGNQQKLLLARYLLLPRRLLILDEPTRGIDVGARAEIYSLMNRLTAQGLAILMISSDMPEVLGMSDRVVVMHEGRTVGELARGVATPERVMALATGAP
jgi:ribose transport system ATP-binding protein